LIAAVLLVSCSPDFSARSDSSLAAGQESPALVENIPPRPNTPAEPDGDYRADSALHVGETGKPQLVEFFAYWCTTCRAMKPTVHGLEAEYWGKVDFVYLDIDDPDNDGIKQNYNYRAQPTFVLVAPDGTEIRQWYGYTAEEELSQAFDDYLDSQS
jgi:thiol-disulfide isomerase/thioredoxin